MKKLIFLLLSLSILGVLTSCKIEAPEDKAVEGKVISIQHESRKSYMDCESRTILSVPISMPVTYVHMSLKNGESILLDLCGYHNISEGEICKILYRDDGYLKQLIHVLTSRHPLIDVDM